jgi:hypothetical protein
MKRNILTLGLVLIISVCCAQKYKFGVICDTRSNADQSGVSGVNVAAVTAVCNHLKASGAKFIIAPGDFICGNVKWYNTQQTPPSNTQQLQAFLGAAKSQGVSLPGEKGSIFIYPVRGNHECYQDILPEDSVEAAWIKNIGYSLPKNGPAKEIGFTYSFEYKGNLFIAVDQYMHSGPTKKDSIRIDQIWLNKELKNHPNARQVFVYGHTPAFAAKHPDCLDDDSLARNIFIESISNRSGVYFCGHDHFYARGDVPVYAKNGTITKYMQQVITPSGAPFLVGSKKWNGKYPNKDVKPEKFIDNVVGYQLVTVNGKKVTVEFFATFDACTITKDNQGNPVYTYNNNWQTWKFTQMDTFTFQLP